MILSDVTSGNRISNSTIGNEQSMPVVGRNGSQVTFSALKAGDSIQAKVVSRDGDSVRLQVDGNKYIDAKLSSGINVEPGKDIIFEVRSTSSGITLSPLFTNTSSDPNISKALSMAGLPLNSDTVTMTKNMMQAGMGIDRASLTNMFRDLSTFPGASVTDIVDLHRLGIAVNEDNLNQINSYKNLSYQLGEGMNDVAGKVTELVDNLINQANASAGGVQTDSLLNASQIFEGLLSIASEYEWSESGTNTAEQMDGLQNLASDNDGTVNSEMSAAERALKLLGEKMSAASEEVTGTDNAPNTVINAETANALRNEISSLFDSLKNDNAANSHINSETSIPSKDASANEMLDFLKNTVNKAISEQDSYTLSRIMNNPVIKDTVMAAVKAQWNITPEAVADKDNVKDMYSRLQRQLGAINEALESTGLKDTAAGNAAGNMSNNLDFLNQVNQMYAYIQLPLKLSTGDDAHGDLYVYSNGKRMSDKDGKVTALLHLDMDHLGPLDVYVAMDTTGLNKKVSTQFSVADEEVLDFLSLHMDELTKRLEAKGYSCTARMSVKGLDSDKNAADDSDSAKRGIEPVLDMTGQMKLAEYSFDVRT